MTRTPHPETQLRHKKQQFSAPSKQRCDITPRSLASTHCSSERFNPYTLAPVISPAFEQIFKSEMTTSTNFTTAVGKSSAISRSGKDQDIVAFTTSFG